MIIYSRRRGLSSIALRPYQAALVPPHPYTVDEVKSEPQQNRSYNLEASSHARTGILWPLHRPLSGVRQLTT